MNTNLRSYRHAIPERDRLPDTFRDNKRPVPFDENTVYPEDIKMAAIGDSFVEAITAYKRAHPVLAFLKTATYRNELTSKAGLAAKIIASDHFNAAAFRRYAGSETDPARKELLNLIVAALP